MFIPVPHLRSPGFLTCSDVAKSSHVSFLLSVGCWLLIGNDNHPGVQRAVRA